ncbi:MAG: hypothetical protein HZA54_09080 [Planctomycetes bacterium]|nr:hypothetical protein [Planctomycetota bacterium]
MSTPQAQEPALLSRVYRTSLLLFCLALLVSLGWMDARLSGGLALGYGLSVASFAYWQWIVRVGFAPTAGLRGRAWILATILFKLPVLGVILYATVSRGWVDARALCVGIVLVHLVLVLKILGRRAADRLAKVDRDLPASPRP